ncbi:hypothetical protein [Cellulomonas phragmiteti]|uniref:Uncharacterized protein n=1 Tax=Cellulomonas phragmiteti TaxID=478780 RepID=A0ABQ4DRK4_9CELL|nr:hypothetical protein [Cellulomonas phragmiteti]GIG41632.1 hypothetical protein Cph01nite_33940 [Cellulomonas phragmiteti]
MDVETRTPRRRPTTEEVRRLGFQLVSAGLRSAVTWLVYELLQQLG